MLELVGGLALVLSAATPIYFYERSELGSLRRRTRRALRRVRRSAKKTHSKIQKAEAGLQKAAKGYARFKRAERLRITPIDVLKQRGVGNVRWTALNSAGVRSLADLARHSSHSLERIHGVGPVTAQNVSSAGRELITQLSREPVDLPAPDSWDADSTRKLTRAAWPVLR